MESSHQQPNVWPRVAATGAEQQESVPAFVGSLQVLEEIGRGSVARVFKARHVHPRHAGRAYALKLLRGRMERSDPLRRLFERELCVLAGLQHENIVRVYEGGVADSNPYIVMELVAGADLRTLLAVTRDAKPIPREVRLYIAAEVLCALTAAHSVAGGELGGNGIVHRDVHPTNVLISYDGSVKLADFGVAAFAHETGGQVVGKPGYLAPEQFLGAPVDERVDLFSFGALLYELLCGAPAFLGACDSEILGANLRGRFRRPRALCRDLDPRLERIICRALMADPEKRYATAAELAGELDPLTPPAAGMPMMLAATVRDALAHDYAAHVHERFAERAAAARERTIAVFAPQLGAAERGRVRALRHSGLRVVVCPSEAELAAALGSPVPLGGIFVDVSAPSFAPEALPEMLARRRGLVPVVATCDELEPQAAMRAERLKAVDLLSGDQAPVRITSAVVRALAGAAGTADAPYELSSTPKRPVRLLLVTHDLELRRRLQTSLADLGVRVEVAVNGYAALRRIERATYHAIAIDGPMRWVQRDLIEELRTGCGMGMVPLLWLNDTHDENDLLGITRSACVHRGAEARTIADILGRMCADLAYDRLFVRYDTRLRVTLDWDGCPCAGAALNLSRGGVLVACDASPRVGSPIRISLELPGGDASVRAGGRVVRIEQREDGEPFGVAIEFESFVEGDERSLVQYIGELARREGMAASRAAS